MLKFLKELANIMSYDAARQDMLFNAYRSFHLALLALLALASLLYFNVLVLMASQYRDSYFGYLLIAFSNLPSVFLLALVYWPVNKFSRRHYVIIACGRVVFEDIFFILMVAHCHNMQNDNDPYPFSLSLLDQSKQESFWCGSRKHAFLYWVSMVLALIPQFMGAVTFLETAVCTGVTGFTLLVSAFYQEGEVRFAYFFFCFVYFLRLHASEDRTCRKGIRTSTQFADE